ncbi:MULTISPECIES: sensor histidine kinase [unclassified Ketobacter]|jgi:Na+/proline symporter/signal transduction histidine kinase|nr:MULTISPECIES: sensor histidine kinase [unclassified Ketobacter]MEC8813730.1 ATP-binding protein [Pseudomonadota bacterium]|tara:strand:+ start:2296 stop:5283 length:2988 start_codon:yes stop_codon:yes gene_type:complete
MDFSVAQLFGIGVGYLLLFFLVAYLTEHGYIPARIVRHPATYVLSLGVFASAWAIYGAVGFAHDFGYNFLAYYLGISGAFMLAPIILAPILRLTQTYQLGSLADLLSFRYRSPVVGAVVTITMLVGIMPLLALQIQAVSDAVHILNEDTSQEMLAFVFVLLIIMFAILFGARHISTREKHEGLVVAIAFESLVKLVGFLLLGAIILIDVFGGPAGLNDWLSDHPEQLVSLYQPLEEGPWRALVAAFFVASVAMPHMFHMAFTENLNPRAIMTASWGLPLYLFLIALPVLIIVWAAAKLNIFSNPEYFTLLVPQALESRWLAILGFAAGLSAASGVIIVCTLSLSAMFLNHIVLPMAPFYRRSNLYSWLLWMRRLLITAIILVSYGFYVVMQNKHTLSELGFLAFVATMQFVPGLFGVLLWPKANKDGFLAGLAAGLSVWLFGLLLPVLLGIQFQISAPLLFDDLFPTPNNSYMVATFAIFINSTIFGIVSMLTESSPAEMQAAETCNVDNLRRPQRWELSISSAREFIGRLSKPLGASTARREVELALNDLAMSLDETRPYALRRLRDQLESNLSGLLGPSVAHEIMNGSVPYVIQTNNTDSQDIHFIESRLEEYHDKLTGLAGELDSLRRFHRQTLQDLPVGVCSLGGDGEVLGWNSALEAITRVSPDQILGSQISHLPEPWNSVFSQFIVNESRNQQVEVELEGVHRWISLHKAAIGLGKLNQANSGQVVVVEDTTEVKMLEHHVAHNERLASVGRLAAGVAHEIGNPITGIACLAQNLRYDSKQPEILDSADQILDQTKRISRIVQSLVSFSHSGTTEVAMEPVYVFECAQEAIDLLSLNKEVTQVSFTNLADPNHCVKGDQQRLTQVFINLLSNARDAMSGGGEVKVISHEKDHTIVIDVEDNGSGIAPEVLKRIYEPFVTTKDPGKGTGLGMSLVYSIVEEHYGQIAIHSPLDSEKGGTRVTITLPRYTLLSGENSEVDHEEQHEPHPDR